MTVRDSPLPAAGRNHGYVRRFGQLDQRFLRVDRATPPPANISGIRAWAITPADSWRSSRLGTILEMRAGFRSATSSRSTPASGGISIRTGRGRPVRICLNASNTASGASLGLDDLTAATWSPAPPHPPGSRPREPLRDSCQWSREESGPRSEEPARSANMRRPGRTPRCKCRRPGPPAPPRAFPKREA